MPFVNDEHRLSPQTDIPGDRCYLEYRGMIRKWSASPRWTTADEIASKLVPDPWARARWLAFLVFFTLHVMPYEIKKREENGEVK